MKVKPAGKKGEVRVELGARDEDLLAKASAPAVRPLPIRLILVPIDFSEYSYKSLDYAAAFAEESGAEILLLHVVPLTHIENEMIAFDYARISREAAGACEMRLKKLASDRLQGRRLRGVATRVGRPVEEILQAARETGADLIVMSTHGYTGLKHAFLGSTTENVVRYAPCPVLTLREHEHDFIKKPRG